MPNLTLNEARIKALTRHKAAYDIPDGKLRGCGVRVLHSGKKRFFVHCQRDRFANGIDEATAEQLLRRDAEVAERAVLSGSMVIVPGSERLLASVARQYAYPPFIRPDPSACVIRTPIPLTAGATFRGWGPSVWRRLSARPAVGHSPPGSNPAGSGRIGEARSCVQASLAPVGTRPISENRQRAMSSLRASATIITRRIRPRAPAVRCSNHSESALSG